MAPVPMTPILTVMVWISLPVFCDITFGLSQHEPGAVLGAVFPGEDAIGQNAVELHVGEGGEEQVPIDLALTEIGMLMHPHLEPGGLTMQRSCEDLLWS